MSPATVAKFLGISRAAAHRLATAPDGIPAVRIGGSVRFKPSDVRAFVEAHTVRPQPRRMTRAERLYASMVNERRRATVMALDYGALTGAPEDPGSSEKNNTKNNKPSDDGSGQVADGGAREYGVVRLRLVSA